jgi:hypothetical protein
MGGLGLAGGGCRHQRSLLWRVTVVVELVSALGQAGEKSSSGGESPSRL